MNRAVIKWHEAEYGMHLECPFKDGFVDEMKLIVPHGERRWDGGRKMWWISDLYLDEVDNLIFHHFERTATGRED